MLARLAVQGPENPKLEMLEGILLKQFGSPGHTRGIIFTRTRQTASSLLLWLRQQPYLQTVGIKPQMLIGAGNTGQSTHMTQVFGRGWRHLTGKKAEQGPQHRDSRKVLAKRDRLFPDKRPESWDYTKTLPTPTPFHFRFPLPESPRGWSSRDPRACSKKQ